MDGRHLEVDEARSKPSIIANGKGKLASSSGISGVLCVGRVENFFKGHD